MDANESSEPNRARDPSPRSRLKMPAFGCGLIIGVGIALMGLAIVILVFRDPLPNVTSEILQAAAARWEANKPTHYRMRVTVRGQRPSAIVIEVRDGQPVEFTLNGQTPKNRETAEFWTAENLLSVVDEEFDAACDPEKRLPHFNVPRDTEVIVRADFDPKYGYPRRYRRLALGTNLELDWTVTEFEPLEAR